MDDHGVGEGLAYLVYAILAIYIVSFLMAAGFCVPKVFGKLEDWSNFWFYVPGAIWCAMTVVWIESGMAY